MEGHAQCRVTADRRHARFSEQDRRRRGREVRRYLSGEESREARADRRPFLCFLSFLSTGGPLTGLTSDEGFRRSHRAFPSGRTLGAQHGTALGDDRSFAGLCFFARRRERRKHVKATTARTIRYLFSLDRSGDVKDCRRPGRLDDHC